MSMSSDSDIYSSLAVLAAFVLILFLALALVASLKSHQEIYTGCPEYQKSTVSVITTSDGVELYERPISSSRDGGIGERIATFKTLKPALKMCFGDTVDTRSP